MTVRLLTPLLGGNPILAGFTVSNLAFCATLILLYKLAELELANRQTGAADNYLSGVLPGTTFFFSCVYTESMFLMWSVACIYCRTGRRWWLAAAAAGMLASATRNLGVVLWALATWEWLRCQGWRLGRMGGPGQCGRASGPGSRHTGSKASCWLRSRWGCCSTAAS